MARYSADQIYGFARRAGFPPDAAASMTAVALAESGGNNRAHNPHGEDSRGLWQINARAHPDLASRLDLFDPLDNARAAFEVSRKGSDLSPWTVTHGGGSARYLHHRQAAQAAAVAYGDGPGRGVWTGTSGYGAPLSAVAGSSAEPAAGPEPATPGPAPAAQPPADDGALQRFLDAALAQRGDRYVFGAEAAGSEKDPSAFDCSELVEWAATQAGVEVPDGASAQYLWAKERGLLIPVDQARTTPGALLFHFSSEPQPGGGRPSTAHVAISLGDDRTIEARNSRMPVDVFPVGRRFTYAAVIPGLSTGGGTPPAPPAPAPPPVLQEQPPEPVAPALPPPPPDLGGQDSDGDGLTDLRERQDGVDPLAADTDGDGLVDGAEVVEGTSSLLADTDGDLLPDAFEIPRGLDPTSPDTAGDGHLDGTLPESWLDSDQDGIDDALEVLLGLDPALADTDADGFTDGLEHRGGFDALDRLSGPGVPAAASSDLDPASLVDD